MKAVGVVLEILGLLFSPVLLGAQVGTAQPAPDWTGLGFFACNGTETLGAHFHGGTFDLQGKETWQPLTYFKVLSAQVQEDDGKLATVAVILENVTGRKSGIVFSSVSKARFDRDGFPALVGAYLHGIGNLPPSWTPAQLGAIQNATAIAGMNREQVACAIGQPESVNDYGDGVIQEVYGGGALLIYWGSDAKVKTVQTFR